MTPNNPNSNPHNNPQGKGAPNWKTATGYPHRSFPGGATGNYAGDGQQRYLPGTRDDGDNMQFRLPQQLGKMHKMDPRGVEAQQLMKGHPTDLHYQGRTQMNMGHPVMKMGHAPQPKDPLISGPPGLQRGNMVMSGYGGKVPPKMTVRMPMKQPMQQMQGNMQSNPNMRGVPVPAGVRSPRNPHAPGGYNLAGNQMPPMSHGGPPVAQYPHKGPYKGGEGVPPLRLTIKNVGGNMTQEGHMIPSRHHLQGNSGKTNAEEFALQQLRAHNAEMASKVSSGHPKGGPANRHLEGMSKAQMEQKRLSGMSPKRAPSQPCKLDSSLVHMITRRVDSFVKQALVQPKLTPEELVIANEKYMDDVWQLMKGSLGHLLALLEEMQSPNIFEGETGDEAKETVLSRVEELTVNIKVLIESLCETIEAIPTETKRTLPHTAAIGIYDNCISFDLGLKEIVESWGDI